MNLAEDREDYHTMLRLLHQWDAILNAAEYRLNEDSPWPKWLCDENDRIKTMIRSVAGKIDACGARVE